MTKLLLKLQDDLNSALKNRDQLRADTLRYLFSKLYDAKIEKQKDLSDEDVILEIQKEVKKHKESIEAYKKGNREDLAKKEEEELKMLEDYLPPELSRKELTQIIQKAIENVGAESSSDMGKVMAQVMPKIKGQADGTTVSNLVKELLFKKND